MEATLDKPQHTRHDFNQAAAEAFGEQLAGILDHGALAVMISVGHRSGLLDALAAGPATSAGLAARSGLAERYVREWLAALVTGGVVRWDPASAHYTLPAEHAVSLTRGGRLGNMAVYAQHVAMMGALEPLILQCFASGAGTRYEDYPRFHEVMAEDSAQTVVAQLFDHVLGIDEDLVPRLEAGIEVLDAGCGRGAALIELARRFPASRFTGYDLCRDAIGHAQRSTAAAGLENLRFAVRDLSHLDDAARFDLITTFDAVHDQKHPQRFLDALFAALRPGGRYVMQDIGGSARLENNLDFPMASFLYAISCFHCTPVSLGQDGEGLGTMWGWETAEAMLRSAGFAEVRRTVFAHDPMNVWFVAHKRG